MQRLWSGKMLGLLEEEMPSKNVLPFIEHLLSVRQCSKTFTFYLILTITLWDKGLHHCPFKDGKPDTYKGHPRSYN